MHGLRLKKVILGAKELFTGFNIFFDALQIELDF